MSSTETTLSGAIKSLLLNEILKPPIHYLAKNLAKTVSESNWAVGVFVSSGKRGFKGDRPKILVKNFKNKIC